MKRRGMLILITTAWTLSAVWTITAAPQPVDATKGGFGQELVLGFLDPPKQGNAGTGALSLFGWALADSGIERVVIFVDDVQVGTARFHLPRPGVTALFPGFSDSDAPGFGFILNTTKFPNGQHIVAARALTEDGTFRFLGGVQSLLFNNSTHDLPPFGDIDSPQRSAEMGGVCDLLDPVRRYSSVVGWVLDLGVEIGDTGVGYVELLVDGSIVANTRLDCEFDFAAGGFKDCYGLPRFDIENLYPFALDAPVSGFRFALDVGELLNRGRAEGHHVLTIRSGDISGQVANVAEIPVTFFCVENVPNENSIGRIERPDEGLIFSGITRFQGWCVDWEGVSRVELYVDGAFFRTAPFGVDSRPSVLSEFAGFPDSLAPVWRAFVDTNKFSNGLHQLQAVCIDDLGDETIIGETTFLVRNPP